MAILVFICVYLTLIYMGEFSDRLYTFFVMLKSVITMKTTLKEMTLFSHKHTAKIIAIFVNVPSDII